MTKQPKLLTLTAIHYETGQLLICCLDLNKLDETDTLFRQFSTYIARNGYVLKAADAGELARG
jgi:hypothetical protein